MIKKLKNALMWLLIVSVFFYIFMGLNFFTMLAFNSGTIYGAITVGFDVLAVVTMAYLIFSR